MARGINLGTFLLICLVQAEHVCGSWASQVQRQNSNAHVGFSQQDSGLRGVGGGSPQDQFRQAPVSVGSAPSSISSTSRLFNPAPAGRSGRTQTGPQPAPGGYPPVRSVQGGSVSKPNWRTADSKPANAQGVQRKQSFGLSTSIASGSAVSVHKLKWDDRTDVSERRTWPGEQGRPGASNPFAPASRHQNLPSGLSSLLGAGPLVPHASVNRRTSATAPARRVSAQRRAKASRHSQIEAPQNERTRNYPGRAVAGNPNQSKLFPATGGTAQEGYKPSSNMALSYPQALAAPYKQNAHIFQPRGLGSPTSQRFGSSEQVPSGTSSVRAGSSPRGFAPTRTLNIPTSFGGSPIRRLKGSAFQKPQVKHTAASQQPASYNLRGPSVQQKPQVKLKAQSQQPASYNLQGQGVHPENKWQRIPRPRPSA